MGITEYGKVVRQFRDDAKVSLRQMADEIDLSPTYISAVEVGEKAVTDELLDKVINFFKKHGRKTRDFAQLRAAVDRTRKIVDVSGLDSSGKLAIATFARRWDDLDREEREKFLRQIGVPPDKEPK